MLEILIVDAELQLVPAEMHGDKQIRKLAVERGKRPEELLLDSNFMHSAIERYFPGRSNRMGRPDIFHMLMNVVLESILNKEADLRLNIHTVEGKFIKVNPNTRIPKSYNRFVGLIEKLLQKGKIESPDGKVLMNLEKISLKDHLNDGMHNILLSPDGHLIKSGELPFDERDTRVVIGGFSEGKFVSDFSGIEEKYSIFEEELTIWTVANECIASYERYLKLQ